MKIAKMTAVYLELIAELALNGVVEHNSRTNETITALAGGWSFKLDLSDWMLPTPSNRKYFPATAAAEVAWQFLGTKDPTFILKHVPNMWSKFVEDGELKTAYGYRWRKHFGRDQLYLAVNELESTPTNRQLFISAWDPAADGLGGPQPKNIPCPVGFTLSRVDGRLHSSVFIRSSDVVVGLPYDVMAYALTVAAVASEIGAEPGTLHVTLAHPHYYHKHNEIVARTLHEAKDTLQETAMPRWTVAEIANEPDDYVYCTKLLARSVHREEWNPRPEIIE